MPSGVAATSAGSVRGTRAPLASAALQDHLAASLGLVPSPPRRPKKLRGLSTTTRSSSYNGDRDSSSDVIRGNNSRSSRSVPSHGSLSSAHGGAVVDTGLRTRCRGRAGFAKRVTAASAAKFNPTSTTTASTTTSTTATTKIRCASSLQSPSSSATLSLLSQQRERVLDAPAPPSLAQRLLLVPAPPPALTESQWSGVKEASKIRGDSSQPCPICKSPFDLNGEQVILSCTHVFHKSCLQSYEHYAGTRRHACPLCRQTHYQARVIHEGARCHLEYCATLIQAAWRGHSVRMKISTLMKAAKTKTSSGGSSSSAAFASRPKGVAEAAAATAALQKTKIKEATAAAAAADLSYFTDQVVEKTAAQTGAVDGFLEEISANLERSRHAMALATQHLARPLSEEKWTVCEQRARCRDVSDCQVCLTSCNSNGSDQPLVLLSCSHIFHSQCISSLEKYAGLARRDQQCPVCRSIYQKREFVMCTRSTSAAEPIAFSHEC